MSYLLELLGRGLDIPMMSMVLPWSRPLSSEDVELLEEAIETNPGHIANLMRIGIHYAQSGSIPKAEKVFSMLLEKNPDNLDVDLAWAAMHSSSGNLDKAVERLEQINREHSDARVCLALGYCYERKGKIDLARNWYKKGSEQKPYLRHSRERLAAIELYQLKYTKAIELLRVLQREHPEDVWYCLTLGQFYLQTRQYDHAISAFEKALTIEPDNFDSHNDEIETLVKNGQIDEAIERMKAVLDDEGQSFADSFIRLADLYSQTGEDKLAVANYKRALEIHPGYLEAAVKLGTQHMRMHRFYDAALMFNYAIEINDRIIAAYIGLGVAQQMAGKTAEADDTLELAAALEPNTNLLYAEMNRLQMKMVIRQRRSHPFLASDDPSDLSVMTEDLLEAQLDRHRQALARTPDQASLHYNYAVLMRGKGDIKESEYHLRRALMINPSYQKAAIKFGLLMREIGNKTESDIQFANSMVLDEESAELHYRLALMYCDRIQFALTMEQIGLAADQQDNKSAYIKSNVMLALQNMALVDRAMYAWRTVCELEPDSPLAFQSQRIPGIQRPSAYPF